MQIPSAEELDELLVVACEIATECGRLIHDERPGHVEVAATKSTATDVVTEMDRRSEALAMNLLGRRRPRDGIVGEEGARTLGDTGITWLVDPIDGTVNYLYGVRHYAVSVAAVVGDAGTPGAWRPVVGAVFDPSLEELFTARTGGGAQLHTPGLSRDLLARPAATLAASLVGTGFGYAATSRAVQGRVAAELLPHVRDLRRFGVASLDLCSVAAGRLDAYYEGGLNAWDYAAAWLVVEEAGGVVRGADGGDPRPDLVFAGAEPVLAELEERVGAALRAQGAISLR